MSNSSLISQGSLVQGQLKDKVAVVTGAGQGIGFETARALVWLGAYVTIAEVNSETGHEAQDLINNEFSGNKAEFIQTDVANEESIRHMVDQTIKNRRKIDIVINNAYAASIGAVKDVPIDKWDLSYQVTLRGPVLLAQHCLPGMLERGEGVVVFVSSSGAAPYMGAYEVFKTAQVELANTLASELEGSGVISFTIGPGIVKTPGADATIRLIAPLYNKTVDEFYQMNASVYISIEEAGAGFAAAVALADKYEGQEISSMQALADAGISTSRNTPSGEATVSVDAAAALPLLKAARETLQEQYDGWKQRNVFERQWVMRDFKKYVGEPAEEALHRLSVAEDALSGGDTQDQNILRALNLPKFAAYYEHQIVLLKGYEKDQAKVAENTAIIRGWIDTIEQLERYLNNAT
jgi:NAD(P)-dependent dehydrogenase (short-subunit alcohol dehydrogenase family)